MLQHRHDFPGYVGNDPTVTWWHNANGTHTKYPHAHDVILETREHVVKPRGTRKDPLYVAPPEYGPTKEEALYATPPEYAEGGAAAAVKEAEELVRQPAKK